MEPPNRIVSISELRRSTGERGTRQKVLVLLNFSENQLSLDSPDLSVKSARVIFSVARHITSYFSQLTVNPFEIWIAELK
jgi:hypothetical protein